MLAIGKIFRNGTANGIGQGTINVQLSWKENENENEKIKIVNFLIGNLKENLSEIEEYLVTPQFSHAIFEFDPADQFAYYRPMSEIQNAWKTFQTWKIIQELS